MTRYLLDTHLLIWSFGFPQRLPPDARTLMEAPDALVHFSLVSLWEVAIKHSLGRTDFAMSPREFADAAGQSGIRALSLGVEACFAVGELPPHHRDPFDRMLVAQAMTAPMFLLTVDRRLAVYSELVTVIG